jgi:hypothetical protein
MATAISSPTDLTNDPPAWEVDGNLWDATESSLTVAGKLYKPGYIHAVFVSEDARAPSPQQVVWGLDADNNDAFHAKAFYDGKTD